MSEAAPDPAPVRAVFLDIGETLLDRGAEYEAWARWLEVPRHTFSAVFGAVVAQGGTVADVIGHFRPGMTMSAMRRDIVESGAMPPVREQDLYPGARAALRQLHESGYFVGIAGNQPAGIADELLALDLPVDAILVSATMTAAKPAGAFFAQLAGTAGCPAAQVLYVGDQLELDVRAALRAGMQVIRVLTGPWGQLVRDESLEAACRAVLASVAELPDVLLG